jgi:hypothetical protein
MQTVLQGTLRLFPAGELLRFLAQHNLNGTLEIESEGRTARIVFEKDRILWSESSGTRDMFEAAVEAFGWSSGSFTLSDSALLPQTMVMPPIQLADALEEAERRKEAASRLPDDALFRVVVQPAGPQVSLTAERFRLLFALSSPRTLRSLADDLTLPSEDVAQGLRSLIDLGLVDICSNELVPAVTAEQMLPESVSQRTFIATLTADDGTMHPILEDESTIGRTPDNMVRVPDGSVSAKHARILSTADGYEIEDRGSRNGTFLNSERITGRRALADGDLVRLGKVVMTFNVVQVTNEDRYRTTGWNSSGF